MTTTVAATASRPLSLRLWEITYSYFPLSFTTFGGPQAHIAIIYGLFVKNQGWLSEEMFAELFSIAQALPGPASTQLTFAIALIREGVIPGIWSFFVWSTPGALIMLAVALAVGFGGSAASVPGAVVGLENGLVSSAIGLTALAAFQLGKKFSIDTVSRALILISGGLAIAFYAQPWLFPCLMIFGGLVTYTMSVIEPRWTAYRTAQKEAGSAKKVSDMHKKNDDVAAATPLSVAPTTPASAPVSPATEEADVTEVTKPGENGSVVPAAAAVVDSKPADIEAAVVKKEEPAIYFTYSWTVGLALLGVWVVFLVLAIIFRFVVDVRALNVLGTFYFTGSIIFGGGPVVVPLLQTYVTSPGWLSDREYLVGLAVINALPGPLFNFAAYCGALALRQNVGTAICGAVLGFIGIFTPGLILMAALLPIWRRFRNLKTLQIIFKGMNAAAAGLVFAAVYLLWNKAISGRAAGTVVGSYPLFTILAAFSFVAAGYTKIPAPVVIIIGGVVGILEFAANPGLYA
ncbi:hypothetical protein SmJEL517_g02563 [Synchytrium microbalum]|uniref:Chromate transporter n=1 Tax=Synchytrium microbalum TaxID=1806994 RepID=A0A507C1C1_9FUNG|nr:uncharacterized protein SmJEL517_g02563 [Synchytrium microbalum]TPX34897.1 hypothetical protein SmJEL517_g02563 [Synchytrium microbalum]